VNSIKSYFISITVCAILCSLLTGMFEKKDSLYKIVKMISSLFLIFTLIRPVTEIRLDKINLLVDEVSDNAQAAISTGEDYRMDSLAAIIKEETEAYILDKAQTLQCTLDVEVIVKKSEPPVPSEVYITGSLSPAAKQTLQQIIEDDLHIAKENQIWIR